MTVDPMISTLLASESMADAAEAVRVSRRPPAEVADLLAAYAGEVVETSPAAAAAVEFLARSIATLEIPQPWVAHEDLSPEVNEALGKATSGTSWVDALSALREVGPYLDERVMIAVLAWHAGLAQGGYSARANGAPTVMALGALVGGRALVLARLAWARTAEQVSVTKAEHHVVRAKNLAEANNWPDLVAAAEGALNSLHARFGDLVRRPDPEPVGEVTPMMVPQLEGRAADLRDSGDPLAALDVLDAAIPVASEVGLNANLMRMLNTRGLILDDLGHYSRAEDDFRESARLAGGLGEDQRRFEALSNSAASYLKRGQPLRALPPLRALLTGADTTDVPSRRIAARNNLALAYAESGDLQTARRLYLEAWDLIDGDRGFQSCWITLAGLARVFDGLGEDDRLRELGQELWRLWQEETDDEALRTYVLSPTCDLTSPEVRAAAEHLADIWVEYGDLPRAGSVVRSLARYDREHGEDARALARLDGFLNSFIDIRSSSRTCIGAEVEAAAIESGPLADTAAALLRLRSAVASAESRLAVATTAYDRDWLIDETRILYVTLIDVLVKIDSDESRAEAYWLHEACRPSTLTSSRDDLVDDGGRPSYDDAQDRVAGVEDVARAIRAKDGGPIVTVSFAETKTQVGAFILRSDDPTPTWVSLPISAAELDAAASSLSLAFNGDPTRFPPRRPLAARNLDAVDLTDVEDVLARLGQVVPALGSAQQVVVVPSPSMEGLPLAAIRDAAGRRLVELAPVVVQPSLTALVTAAGAGAGPAGPWSVFVAGTASAEDAHPDRFEADARIFDAVGVGATSVSGTATTATAILEGLRSARVAHISCHGFVDAQDPMGSGLLVSDGDRRPSVRTQSVPVLERRRFELTVRDMAETSFELDLVSLRACSTARRAAVAAKEEASTLLRALQVAGCRAVVSTLWNVDQDSSLDLFTRFYQAHLREGLAVGEAMAVAQREMIASGTSHAHLYHWAPYTVSGDWKAQVR